MIDKTLALQMKLEGHSYRDIGKVFGVTHQAVQKALSPPPPIRTLVSERANNKCQRCGIIVKHGSVHHKGHAEDTYNAPSNLEWLCSSCHTVTHAELRPAAEIVTLVCDTCGRTFTRPAWEYRHQLTCVRYTTKQTFCSRKCFGRYAGTHSGFTVHPENANHHHGGNYHRKWDRDLIWQTHIDTGYGSKKLSPILGIPASTLDVILRKLRLSHANT